MAKEKFRKRSGFAGRQALKGSTATEFAMIGTTFVMIAVVMCTMVGDNLRNLLLGLKSDMDGQASLAGTVPPPSAPPASTPPGSTPSAGSDTLSVSIGDGGRVTIDLKDYPATFRDAIRTNGANGTTRELGTFLKTLGDTLKEQGVINEEQGSALAELANHIYTIAAMEEFLENLANEAGIASESATALFEDDTRTFEYDGNLYSGEDLARILAEDDKNDTIEDAREDTSGPAIYHLNKLLENAGNKGALKDPVVRSIVNLLVDDVKDIASEVENKTKAYVDNDDKTGRTLRDLQVNASDWTREDGDGICAIGGGNGNGNGDPSDDKPSGGLRCKGEG